MGLWPQFRSPLVWDVFAVGTYLTVSFVFWFVGLIPDLATLRDRKHVIKPQTLKPGANPLAKVKGELLEVLAELTPGTAEEISFNLRGIAVTYDAKKQTLSCLGKTAALPLENGKIRLRMLVDRTAVDIFGNDGQLYMPMGVVVALDNKSLAISAKGGAAQINSMTAYELKSAWK
jgi:sucrose-6-phosphate hydrolase SacC (GH32 family)